MHLCDTTIFLNQRKIYRPCQSCMQLENKEMPHDNALDRFSNNPITMNRQ